MKHDRFEDILDARLKRIRDVLVVKTEEYATDDQLHNIRQAAALQGVGMPQAVAGMMAKHTVSIFTMIADGKPHDVTKWDEKITDHIVWLILLEAALIDNANPDQGSLPC